MNIRVGQHPSYGCARIYWFGLFLVEKSSAGTALLFASGHMPLDRAAEIGYRLWVADVLGVTVFGPGSRKIAAAIDSGDEATERALDARLGIFGVIDSLVVLLTIAAMVSKAGGPGQLRGACRYSATARIR